MHKLSLGGLILAVFLLSGCSLVPSLSTPTQPTGGDTGLRNPFQAGATAGAIWRSTDGGKTFEPKITVDEKRKITTADVLDISFVTRDQNGDLHPKRAPSIFIGTIDNGIFKSTDSGEIWEVKDFPPKKVYRFTADTVNPERMFATGVVGGRGKIFRTKDGGANWEDVYTEPGTGTVLISLAQDPRATETIFAGTSTGTVVRSMDSGETWKNIGTDINGPIINITFDAKIQNRLYALIYQGQIYRSDDNGLTWKDPYKTDEVNAKGENGIRPNAILSLVPDPFRSGTLYAGTGGGLYRSVNGGVSWEKLNLIESAESFPLRGVAVNPKNSDEISLVAGRTFYKSTNNGDTWSVVPLNIDRDVSVLAYDPFDPNVLYLGLRKFSK